MTSSKRSSLNTKSTHSTKSTQVDYGSEIQLALKSFYTHKDDSNIKDDESAKAFYKKDNLKVFNPESALKIRSEWAIDEKAYQKSIYEKNFISFPNQGASGALFFKSTDELYLVKTISYSESKFLKQFLQKYREEIEEFKKHGSLLTKFLEHFKIKIKRHKYYMVVMNNLFPKLSPKFIYDLKGSTYHRRVTTTKITGQVFKDENFMETFSQSISLDTDSYKKVINIIKKDSDFLKKLKVIDYSLLLVILKDDNYSVLEKGMPLPTDNTSSIDPIDKSAVTDNEDTNKTEESRKPKYVPPGVIFAFNKKNNEKIIILIQIIDTLIQYKAFKKTEYLFKSAQSKILPDRKNFSVIPPVDYQSRFFEFMKNCVFKKSDGSSNDVTTPTQNTLDYVGNLTVNSQDFVKYMLDSEKQNSAKKTNTQN